MACNISKFIADKLYNDIMALSPSFKMEGDEILIDNKDLIQLYINNNPQLDGNIIIENDRVIIKPSPELQQNTAEAYIKEEVFEDTGLLGYYEEDTSGYLYNGINYASKEAMMFQMKLDGVYEREAMKFNNSEDAKVILANLPDKFEVEKEFKAEEINTFDDLVPFFDNTTKEYINKLSQNITFLVTDKTAFLYPQNIIGICPEQVIEVANKTSLSPNLILNVFFQHELIHGLTTNAIVSNKFNKEFREIFNIVKKYNEINPFYDNLRAGFLSKIGLPYALTWTDKDNTDLLEFTAEAFTNPYFKEYIQNIKYKDKNIFQKIVDLIKQIFGITSTPYISIYDRIDALVKSEAFQAQQEIEQNIDMELYANQQKTSNEILAEFIQANELEKTLKSKVSDLIDIFKGIKKSIPLDKANKSVAYDTISNMIKTIDNPEGKVSIPTMLSQMTSIRALVENIERTTNELIEKATSPEEKITISHLGLKQVAAFKPYIDLCHSIIDEFAILGKDLSDISTLKIDNSTPTGQIAHKQILRMLEAIVSPVFNMEKRLKQLQGDPIYTFLSNLVDPITKEQYEKYNAELQTLYDKLEDDKFPNKKRIQDKIKTLEQGILSKFPKDAEWFKRELNGDVPEIGIINKSLEAAQQSKSPMVQLISKYFKDLNIDNDRESQIKANTVQVLVNNIILHNPEKSNLQIDKFNEPIINQVVVIEDLNEDGTIKSSYVRDALLNIYTPEYYEEYNRLKLHRDSLGMDLRSKSLELNHTHTPENEKARELAEEVYLKAKKAYNDFLKEHTEREYHDRVYEVEDILDEDIHPDFPGVTLKKEKGELYSQLNEFYVQLNTATTNGERTLAVDAISILNVRLREMESLIGKTPGTKEYYLAQQAVKYKEGRKEIGKHILPPENKIFHEKLVAEKESEYKRGYITKEELDFWKQRNIREVLSPDYYNQLKGFSESITMLNELIFSKLESSGTTMFDLDSIKETKKANKEHYKSLQELSLPYRDNNGIINGSLMALDNPDKVKQVKLIQTQIEELRRWKDSLTNVSLDERMDDSKYGWQTNKEEKENKLAELERLGVLGYVNELNDLYRMLDEISDTVNTEYFSNAYDDEFNKFMQSYDDNKIIKEIDNNQILINNSRYIYDDKTKLITVVNTGQVTNVPGLKSFDDFVQYIKKDFLKEEFKDSEWFINNHYKKLTYNENVTKGNRYVEEDVPLYIWQHTVPTDKTQILKLPSSIYNIFEINPEFKNNKYKKLPDGLPLPKSTSKYINKDYLRLKNSTSEGDNAYFQYLEGLRKIHHESQSTVSFKKRLGDSIPALPRTSDEKRVDFVKSLKNPKYLLNYAKDVHRQLKHTDEQELGNELQGIVSSEYIEKREIPELLTGKLDTDKQSKNVSGAILMHSLFSSRREKLQSIKPIIDSIYDKALETKRKSTTTVTNEKTGIKSKITKIMNSNDTRPDFVGQLKGLIEAEMYGKRVDDVQYNVMGMDLNKVLNKVMKINAFSAFAGNIFSPIKNTVSGKVQSIIEQNKKFGHFSTINWAKAEKNAFLMIKDLASQYSKFGNQTLNVQLLDYFQVLQGTYYDKLGHKTQWHAGKHLEEIFTAPKELSEFQLQITQFLALADATFIDSTQGKIKLLDAFELKDGNIHVKDIITDKKEFNRIEKKFTFLMHDLNIKLNGAYRLEEKSLAQRNILGRAAFFMNQYLIPGLASRYSNYRYYIADDDVRRGFYRSGFDFLIKDLFKYGFNYKERYNELNDSEKHNLSRAFKEAMIIVSTAALMMLIGGGDDDKNLDPTQKLALAYLMGISMEEQTFNPIAGADDMIRKIKNPFVFARTLGQMRNGIYYSLLSITGDDSAFYKKHSGIHNAGDSKAVAAFLRLISISPSNAFTFDIDALYNQQKSFYSGNLR